MQDARHSVTSFEATVAEARTHLQESQEIQNNIMLQV